MLELAAKFVPAADEVYRMQNLQTGTDPECRLFNAHRQAELIRAQLGAGRLCSRHKNMASDVRVLADRARISAKG